MFPFGWGELWGIADRTDYDLKAHQTTSGVNMEYVDPVTNEKYVPYVVEPSLGADRMVLAFLCNAYEEEELEGGDTRIVLLFKLIFQIFCQILFQFFNRNSDLSHTITLTNCN